MKSYDLSDPGIRENPPLLASLKAAEPLLEEAIGASAGHVDARWRLGNDPKGCPVLTLKIWDRTRKQGAEREFEPDELRSEAQLGRRFRDLWLAVLFDTYSRVVDELLALPTGGVES